MDAELLVWHILSFLLMVQVVVFAAVLPGLMLIEWVGLASTGLIQPTFWMFTLSVGTGTVIFGLLLALTLDMALYQVEREVSE
jgi:hypothetical protein